MPILFPAAPETIAQAAEALRRGKVVAYPTETRYGLAVRADSDAAIECLKRIKGREDKPLSVLVANQSMLEMVVEPAALCCRARQLIARYWPGPLTLVLPARKGLPTALYNAQGGVGVRVSSDPVAAELVCALSLPLTATSANRGGKPAATTAQEAALEGVAMVLDDGERDGEPSTVMEVLDGTSRILRQGNVRP